MTSAEMLKTAARLRTLRDENRKKADELLAWADLLEDAQRYFEKLVSDRTNAAASTPETGVCNCPPGRTTSHLPGCPTLNRESAR
jgi:hypothetical protein